VPLLPAPATFRRKAAQSYELEVGLVQTLTFEQVPNGTVRIGT